MVFKCGPQRAAPNAEMNSDSNAPTDTEKLRQRNRELSILNSIAGALNREIDLNQALQTTLSQVAELLGLETGWIWLLREESEASYLAAAQNLPPALADYPGRMEGACYCLDTFHTGDLAGAANINVIRCSRLKWLEDGTFGLKYHASIPLYAHGKKMGVLNVASTDWRELSAEDLKILHTVGDLLSIAIERARLFAASVQLGALEERNRLAREIHDTLAQALSAIAMHLETADALLEQAPDRERLSLSLDAALHLTRNSLEEARRSVLDLRAAPLEGQTLMQAVADLVADLEGQRTIQFEFRSSGTDRPLPARIETGAFRIVQEALANVVQHSGASQATLEIAIHSESLTLTVCDNGRGFQPKATAGGHFGLLGMRERARLLGGQFRLVTKPGAGTRIEVEIPIERQ